MSTIIDGITVFFRSLFTRNETGGVNTMTREPEVPRVVRPADTVSDPVGWAAAEMGVDRAVIAAVLAVESGGQAMLPSGKAVVRFEGATFSRLTNHVHDEKHPTLSMRSWRDNGRHVKGGEAEWTRIEEAARLNTEAAYRSASYGAAQIMGFNYEIAGYPDVFAFVADMNDGEAGQVRAFVNFVTGSGLVHALKAKDWRTFARGYNGSGQVDHYAAALAKAYARMVGGSG